jgi:hypothetical protein
VKVRFPKKDPEAVVSRKGAQNLDKELTRELDVPQVLGSNQIFLKKQIEHLQRKIREDEQSVETLRDGFFDALEILQQSIAPDGNLIKARHAVEQAKVELAKAEEILLKDQARLKRLTAAAEQPSDQ